MAKTLQEILRPEFLPDIVSRMKIYSAPPVLPPRWFVSGPTYDIPTHYGDIRTLLESSIAFRAGVRRATLGQRGGGKFYLSFSED